MPASAIRTLSRGTANVVCRVESRGQGRVRTFVGTTSAVATDGGVLLPDGMDATVFDRRPIALWSHQADNLGIGKVVARRRISIPDGWEMDIDFAPPEVSAKADEVLRFLDWAGFGAVSLGWRFLEVDWNPETAELIKYGLPRYGWIGRRWELVEVSVVNCQADPNALMTKAIAAGVLTERAARELLVTEEPSTSALDQFAARIERALESAVTNLTDQNIALGERLAVLDTRLTAAQDQPQPAAAEDLNEEELRKLYELAAKAD